MTSSRSIQLSLSTTYVLDANILIAAWHDHYPIDLHPGFWDCLEHYWQEKRLSSIDKVYDEINNPKGLVDWLKSHWHGAFASTNEPQTALVFSQMQTGYRPTASSCPRQSTNLLE